MGALLGGSTSLRVEAEKHHHRSPRRLLLGYNLAVVAFLLIHVRIVAALPSGLKGFGAGLAGDGYLHQWPATDGAVDIRHSDLFWIGIGVDAFIYVVELQNLAAYRIPLLPTGSKLLRVRPLRRAAAPSNRPQLISEGSFVRAFEVKSGINRRGMQKMGIISISIRIAKVLLKSNFVVF